MYKFKNFIAPWIIVLLLFLSDCGMPPGVPPGGFTSPGPPPPVNIMGFIDASLLNDSVIITFQSDGQIFYSGIAMDGPGQPVQFFTTLPTGTYDLIIKANDHATAVITGIPVSAATITSYIVTMVSTSAMPITLPTSTMRNISGTVLLNPPSASTGVYIFSNQTFSGGPTVTVSLQKADPSTGAYTMSLPVAAPLLGQYGTGTLPIMFTSQSATAGKYTVVATTYGPYRPQSVSTDISITDVIQDFILIPY